MFSGFSKILANTAASVEKAVQSTVHDVTGPKALQDFELGDQIGSGGPGMLWKLYRATPISEARKAVFPEVCVWFLDKKALAEERSKRGTSKAAEDSLLDIFRADGKVLQKLRHPGVVRVIEPLDESKWAMAMVTEPIFSSLANALGSMDNMSSIPAELEKLELGQLEVKQGLMQLSEALSFIHRNARLIHRGISPESVFITTNGGWKFAGFGFSVMAEENGNPDEPPFIYPEYDVDYPVLPLQPPLDYTAPELSRPMPISARGSGLDARLSVDLYSMGLLAYHLIVKRPLLRCQNNLETYHSKVPVLSKLPFNEIPMDLEPELRQMLNMDPSQRPTASDFTGSRFFTEDARLKALHFLDEMIGRANDQRAEFLNSLGALWSGFDSRVLRFKVLPPLLNELKNPATQLLALPWVLEVVEVQDANDFKLRTQTMLIPAMEAARGELLLLFLRHMAALMSKASANLVQSHLLPMMMRAFEDPDPRLQEETLRRSIALVPQLDFGLVREAILPRIHLLALQSSVAAVRAQALASLGELVPSLDRAAVMDILQTCARCSANDQSPATVMCIVGVADIIRQGYGMEFTAQFIIPLLSPLLTIQQLSNAQFARLLKLVIDVLTQLQDKRGVSLSEADSVSLDLASMGLASAKGDMPPIQEGSQWSSADGFEALGSKANNANSGGLGTSRANANYSPSPASQATDPFAASMPPLGAPSSTTSTGTATLLMDAGGAPRASPLQGAATDSRPWQQAASPAGSGAMSLAGASSLAKPPSVGGGPLPDLFSGSSTTSGAGLADPFAASSLKASNFGQLGGSSTTSSIGISTGMGSLNGFGAVGLVPDQPPPADDLFADWPPRKASSASSSGASLGAGANVLGGSSRNTGFGVAMGGVSLRTQQPQSVAGAYPLGAPAGTAMHMPAGMLAPPPRGSQSMALGGFPGVTASSSGQGSVGSSPTLYPNGPTLLPSSDPFNLLG